MHKKKNQRGFTLLELLIALFIFTIVSVIMVTGLKTVLNNQSVTEKSAERFNQLQIALLLMSRDIEQAINRPVTNAKGILDLGLIGTPRRVDFTHAGLPNPEGLLPRSTLQRTAYLLENKCLIRETWPVLDQTSKTKPDQRVLLEDTEDMRFEYLDQHSKFQNNWPPADTQQTGLPRAIRVTLILKNWGKLTQLYVLPGQTFVKSE